MLDDEISPVFKVGRSVALLHSRSIILAAVTKSTLSTAEVLFVTCRVSLLSHGNIVLAAQVLLNPTSLSVIVEFYPKVVILQGIPKYNARTFQLPSGFSNMDY